MEHARQSRPDSGDEFQEKVIDPCQFVPFSLESGFIQLGMSEVKSTQGGFDVFVYLLSTFVVPMVESGPHRSLSKDR